MAFDPSEPPRHGVLEEMSYAELQERLSMEKARRERLVEVRRYGGVGLLESGPDARRLAESRTFCTTILSQILKGFGSTAYLIATIGVDTTENQPLKVSRVSKQRLHWSCRGEAAGDHRGEEPQAEGPPREG